MKKYKHLFVRYPERFDAELGSEVEQFGSVITNRIYVERYGYEDEIVGSTDSFMYAVVTYVVLKPLVDSFLKELGSEAAKSLKKLLSHLIDKIKSQNSRSYTLEDLLKVEEVLKKAISNKEREAELKTIGEPNPPIAIRIQLETRYSVDFIFPDDITAQDAGPALSGIERILENYRSDQETKSDNTTVDESKNIPQKYIYVFRNNRWTALTQRSRGHS